MRILLELTSAGTQFQLQNTWGNTGFNLRKMKVTKAYYTKLNYDPSQLNIAGEVISIVIDDSTTPKANFNQNVHYDGITPPIVGSGNGANYFKSFLIHNEPGIGMNYINEDSNHWDSENLNQQVLTNIMTIYIYSNSNNLLADITPTNKFFLELQFE